MQGIIRIIEKPEWLSWDDLANCQYRAHESNKTFGVNMTCANYTGNMLKDAVEDGVTLVALNESNVLVGMLSVVFRDINQWWHKGKAAYICYVAVAPEFKGSGVYKILSKKADEIVRNKSVNVKYLHTHVDNKIAIKAYQKDGYLKVRFSPGSGTNYYCVEMAQWIDGGGNRYICRLMYLITELITRVIYKPGKIRRF